MCLMVWWTKTTFLTWFFENHISSTTSDDLEYKWKIMSHSCALMTNSNLFDLSFNFVLVFQIFPDRNTFLHLQIWTCSANLLICNLFSTQFKFTKLIQNILEHLPVSQLEMTNIQVNSRVKIIPVEVIWSVLVSMSIWSNHGLLNASQFWNRIGSCYNSM